MIDHFTTTSPVSLLPQFDINTIVASISKHMYADAQTTTPSNISGVVGETGVIFIHGIILELDHTTFGCVSPSIIRSAIDTCINAGCKRIVFDIDSPGGETTCVAELCDYIYALRHIGVNTIAFSQTTMASAAYWLACGCDAIVSTRSANIGAIGVYMSALDASKSFENDGLRVVKVSTHELKGTGAFGTPITPAQEAYMQRLVDATFSQFKSAVLRTRKVDNSVFTGESFTGEQALPLGLIDRVDFPAPSKQ